MNSKKPIFHYFVILAGLLLLILNLFSLDDAKDTSAWLRISSNILVIVAMVFTIRQRKNSDKN